MKKNCPKCNILKTLEKFHKNNSKKYRAATYCISCINIENKNSKICAKCKIKYIGTHISYCKNCYNEYKRNSYIKNRDKEIKRCLLWNKNNPEKVAKNMRMCRKRKPDYFLEYQRNYINNHKDKRAINDRNKRAKRKNAIGFNRIILEEWESLKKSHKYKCFYCGKKFYKKLTLDHYIPLSKGGKHIISNIVPACKRCNGRKTNLMPDVFIERMKNES